jgi:hypothetical protein
MNAPTAVIACIGIVANILVIATFGRMRKLDRKLSSCGVHLLVLAVTDLVLSLYYAVGFMLRLLMENNHISKSWITILTFMSIGVFSGTMNRILTLYITFTRALIVFSLRQANLSRNKSERDHIRETLSCGLVTGAVFGVAVGIAVFTGGISTYAVVSSGNLTVSQLFQNKQYGAFGPFFFGLFVNVAMAALATYILWKAQWTKFCQFWDLIR